jgi:hypothetical protein
MTTSTSIPSFFSVHACCNNDDDDIDDEDDNDEDDDDDDDVASSMTETRVALLSRFTYITPLTSTRTRIDARLIDASYPGMKDEKEIC